MNAKPVKQLEIETYYTNGVGVTVKIDYINGTIDLLNTDGTPKKWVFAGRTEEYMAGWQNIFDAMKHAVAEATKKLSKHNIARMRNLEEKKRGFVRILKEESKKKK